MKSNREVLEKLSKDKCHAKGGTWKKAMDYATDEELTTLVLESMDEYAKQKALEFGEWIAGCATHRTDMSKEELNARGNNDWVVIGSRSDIFVKDTKALYTLFIKSREKAKNHERRNRNTR